ncbi:MAG TPA: carboxymuconolactone decarboxylase family protein [Gemmatimonadaceae bacterium]|nr:carboxymuconolactone decarboxylase family protein [Gemmatimonadaceae bacterium]
MTAFPIHTIDTAPTGSKETLKTVKETIGMIPNLAAGMAESPTLVRAFFAVREIYAQGTLTGADIQVLSLANAYENDCEWCVAFHSTLALKEGVTRETIDALRAGQVPRDARFAALSNLSRALIKNRGNVSGADLKAFYAAGFTKAQALEVVLGIGFSVMANFAGHLINAPVDHPFEPFMWKKAAAAA